jgi:hypothetical protein
VKFKNKYFSKALLAGRVPAVFPHVLQVFTIPGLIGLSSLLAGHK